MKKFLLKIQKTVGLHGPAFGRKRGRKIAHGALVAMLSVLVFASCTALGISSGAALNRIHQGQTPEEVHAIMKCQPDYRRFTEDGLEQWEYRFNQQQNGDCDVVLISFRNGRVASMETFPYVAPRRRGPLGR